MPALVRNEPRAAPAGGSATEQPSPALPTPVPTLKPAMQARPELETLEERNHERLHESQEGAAATAATASTEHSEENTSLPVEKQMIYSIVNEFLNKMTFHHPQAEELLVEALNDEACLKPSIYLHVQEVFSQIFFYYPNGLKDRSVWEQRDTGQYIR